jgi:hypothetical protein
MGANINRRTQQNVQDSQLELEKVVELSSGGIFKLMVARVPDLNNPHPPNDFSQTLDSVP